MLLYLLSRIVSTVAGSVYPAYASYKAINSRNSNRLTAWLMYWTVMGLFTLVEFVLDTFVFWFPFYYEIKLIFVLWMILPQTQGSIYLYQTVVDPYLAEHENDIDKALKDMQTQAMAMGMRYIKQAIQLIQNLVLDFVRKGQIGTSSLTDQDSMTSASAGNVPVTPQQESTPPASDVAAGGHTTAAQAAQGYFSWAYSALSPKLAAVATMASQSVSRAQASRPLPEPPVDLYSNRRRSSSSTASTSKEASSSSAFGFGGANIFGISSSSSASTPAARSRPAGWAPGGGNDGNMEIDSHASLRNRKISLYDDYEGNDSKPYTVGHSAHSSESSWSSFTGHPSPHSPAGDY